MTYYLYSVKDNVAGRFSAPTLSLNDNVAKRDFCVMVQKNPIKSDLSLHRVGAFDIESGEVKPLASELLMNGSDVKKEE